MSDGLIIAGWVVTALATVVLAAQNAALQQSLDVIEQKVTVLYDEIIDEGSEEDVEHHE